MEGLVHKTNVDAIIFLYETPLRNPNFTTWVDSYRHRGMTLLGRGTIEVIDVLNTNYIQGLVGEISYEMGIRSVKVLVEPEKSRSTGKPFITDSNFFATKLISYSIIPIDLDKAYPPEYDSNLLGGVEYVGFTAFGIVVMTSFVFAIWTVMNRNAVVVRAAQPFFLMILISGIFIFSSTIIPLSHDDDGIPESKNKTFGVGVCMAQPWLAFTGFSIIFSALFSKTWRVNRLFHSQRR